MLDSALLEQLKTVFQPLKHTVSLVLRASSHAQQSELRDMLRDIAGTSDHIELVDSHEKADVPQFSLQVDGKATGVSFRGIPGGHEFTSLILGILNGAGLGKLPDAGLLKRMVRLPKDMSIRTYISLTCENCPDVVQALNQIAFAHGQMHHEMVDGGLVQEEVKRLGVQGVPAVFVDDELIHSGRSTLAELLTKLEARFATRDAKQEEHLGHYDVVVVGGGPAGASAAIYSVRKGLKTALIAEKIGGQVQETKGIENLVSVIYTEGPLLSASFESHLRSYPVDILEHRRVSNVESGGQKKLLLDSGESLTYDSLIIATGAKWKELNIPGEKDYLGRGVAFCPHCDGPYYKGKSVAVIGGGNSGVEAALDLSGICRDVVLIEYADALKADEVLIRKLHGTANIKLITSAKTSEIVGDGEKVNALRYLDRKTDGLVEIGLDGVFVQIGLHPNSQIVKDLVTVNRFGEIVVDEKGRTNIPHIYAAGDVTTTPFKQIVIAMGEGAKVALTAFEDRLRA